MKHAFAASVITALFAICALGQTPPCPTVRVTSPDTTTSIVAAIYTASVVGGDKNVTPTYNWTVSASAITSGQGTASITVDTKGMNGQWITASVDVGGFDRACNTGVSSTTSVADPAVEARMFDSTMKSNAQAALDNLVVELKAKPTDQVYVIAYGGRRSYKGEAEASLKRAKDYLVKKGIEAGRIITVDGGYREEAWRELWIAPPGATPPYASPNVDPSEVILQKAPPAKKAAKKKKS